MKFQDFVDDDPTYARGVASAVRAMSDTFIVALLTAKTERDAIDSLADLFVDLLNEIGEAGY